jgi:putative oxidoreductase
MSFFMMLMTIPQVLTTGSVIRRPGFAVIVERLSRFCCSVVLVWDTKTRQAYLSALRGLDGTRPWHEWTSTGANYHRIACGENNAMKPYAWIRSVLIGNRSWEQFAILLARVSLGLFFAISGGNKLFVASRTRQMYETLAGAGIPFPNFMTYFISAVDFIGGCLLVIGLLSSLWCAALIIEMAVAIITVQLATIPTGLSFLNWLDELLYLPETMYIILLIGLICSGPGRVSVDSRIARAFGYQNGQDSERTA